MAQNIYDQQVFFDGYAHLPRSQHGLNGAPEWPAIEALLPPLKGLRAADLGCGYGWFCRYAREAGADEVLGIDLSEKMLERARELTDDGRIRYQLGDLESLDLNGQAFDLVYSSLALHYLQDIKPLLQTVCGALTDGGWFIFSTEHPIYTSPLRDGWLVDIDGQKSWPVNHYQAEGRRVRDWFAKGVVKYHRTLATTLNSIMDAGLRLHRLVEFGPSAVQIAANPSLAEEAERPMMAIIAAQK